MSGKAAVRSPSIVFGSASFAFAQKIASQAWHRGVQCRSFRQRTPLVFVAACDIFITLVVAPNLSILLLTGTGIYRPLWHIFGTAEAGIFGAWVQHGSVLAACWLVSAAFAGMFDEEVTNSGAAGSSAIWWRLFVAFFVNAWLLLCATSFMGLFQPFNEADVLRMGIDKDIFGPSGLNVDVKVFRQIIDLNIDIAIEAVLVGSWRLFCADIDPISWKTWSRQIWGD